ncbi:MAG: glycosyltransferase [Clostridiales bacterium]|nr:glycosyltransferase [Clostridiales bacterium]
MKILELFDGKVRNCGEESFVFSVLRNLELPEAQIDCMVIEDFINDDYRRQLSLRGGEIYELGLSLHKTKLHYHIYRPALEFLKAHRYDIVHIHASSIAAPAFLSAAAANSGAKKVIVHSHVTGNSSKIMHLIMRTLASASMHRHVDVFCACSSDAANWKFAPKTARNAIIIKNGIDTARFSFSPAIREKRRGELGIDNKTLVVGNVGRLSPEKNQIFLLRVFSEIIKKRPDARLLLLGDGKEREKLEKESAALPKESVIFTGDVSDVPSYLQAMDVFVFPSLYEGFGIAAIEAEAAGLPVVASEGVPRETDLTGRVTFLPLSADPAVWADAVLKSADAPRTDGSEAVRAAGYDMSYTVAQIAELYKC